MSASATDRVTQLESDLAALRKRCGFLAVAMLGLVFLEGASMVAFLRREAPRPTAPAKHAEAIGGKVEATAFILNDEQGNPRAVLGIDETGGPELVMAGVHSKATLTLGINSKLTDSPSLKMTDASGETRLLADLSPGGAGLSLWNSAGRRTINLHQTEINGSQSSYLHFAGLDGKAFAQFGMSGSGDPDITIVDGVGKKLVQVPAAP